MLVRSGACAVLGAVWGLGGCLSPPAESTLVGLFEGSGSFLGDDLTGEDLDIVCETAEEVLAEPMEIAPRGDPAEALFAIELPEDESLYCYFVQRHEPMDRFLGFLGLEAGDCHTGTGQERLWMEWDGRNRYTGTVAGGTFRNCPDVDLSQPEPDRVEELDPCVFCGGAMTQYSPEPDFDLDSAEVLPVCVGVEQQAEHALIQVRIFHLFDGDGEPGTPKADLQPVRARWERIDGAVGITVMSPDLANTYDVEAAGMLFIDEDTDGQVRSIEGLVGAVYDEGGILEGWVARSVAPLQRLDTCTMPDSLLDY